MTPDTIGGLTFIAAGIILLAWPLLRLIGRLASAHVDQMVAQALATGESEWESWLQDVPGLDETPIYNATAEHIARHAVVGIEDEWAELNGEAR